MGQGAHRKPPAKGRPQPPGGNRPAQANSDHKLKVDRTTFRGVPVEERKSSRPSPGLIGKQKSVVTKHRSQQGPWNNLEIAECPHPKLPEPIDDRSLSWQIVHGK